MLSLLWVLPPQDFYSPRKATGDTLGRRPHSSASSHQQVQQGKCQFWPWVPPRWCPQMVSLSAGRDLLPAEMGGGNPFLRQSRGDGNGQGDRSRSSDRSFPCLVGEHSLHHEVPPNSGNPSTAFSDSQLSGISSVIQPMRHEFISE